MSEGCKAFDDLHELTNKLVYCGLETIAIQNLQTKLNEGRNYLTPFLIGDLIVFILASHLYRFNFLAASHNFNSEAIVKF